MNDVHIERFFNDGWTARHAGLPIDPGNSHEWTKMQLDSWRAGWADADQTIASESKPITIQQLAIHRGLKMAEDGSYSGGDIAAVGLEIMGGCYHCAATIAAYNAYPSKNGFWKCEDCIGDDGYATVEEANFAIFGEGEAPNVIECGEKSDTATILAALRLFQRQYENKNAKEIQQDWPDHFQLVTPPFDDPELCVSPQPLSTDDIDDLCERINFGEWPKKQATAKPTAKQLRYIETAREMIAGGCHFDADDIEIDDAPASDGSYPKTSEVEGEGSWVQAWVWVTNDDACICRECGEPYADGGDGFDGMCGECADKAEPVECDKCGKEVTTVIGCPDGAEICQECFDQGKH